ncbi:hypothetical protein ABEQ76_05535 [Bacillus velezensis]
MTTYIDSAVLAQKALIKTLQKSSSVTKHIMIKTGQERVQSDVEDVYKPHQYQRTGELKSSFQTTNEVNGISLTNTRSDEGRDVAMIVETGEGYQYEDKYGYGYGKPRTFMTNTYEQLKDGRLLHAITQDVKNNGYATIK